MNIEGNVATFNAELVRDSSFGQESMGMHQNTMEFGLTKGTDKQGYIEWVFADEDGEEDVVEIGLWFEKGRVVDYDGVFELPKEAIMLLEAKGYDCSEVVV